MLVRYSLLLACALLPLSACTSMSSTMLTRDEMNQFWTRKGNLKGVPITLKVPTHVQLTIFERHYLIKRPGRGVERLRLGYVVRDVAQDFIYTEKIFTVDFKRPAAGLYNLNLNLTDDQYIQSLQHDVTDQTIADVTTLLGNLIPTEVKGLNAMTAAALTDQLQEIQSVVATDIFEIDAPDFEQQMTQFMNCHLNQAHDAWVAPPQAQIHRSTLTGYKHPADLCGGILNVEPNAAAPALGPGGAPGLILPMPQQIPPFHR